MSELKPCPFCGGAASLVPSAVHSTACAIGCRDETCPAFECVWNVNKASAIAAWNRRFTPAEDVRREALEEAAKVADEAQASAREEVGSDKEEMGEDYDPNSFGAGFLSGEITASINIATAIRALSALQAQGLAAVPVEPTNAMLEPANMIEPMRESLRQILADMPTPLCEHLHHAREDQHRFDQECPVEKRLNAAITKGNTAFGKDKP